MKDIKEKTKKRNMQDDNDFDIAFNLNLLCILDQWVSGLYL